MMKTWAQSYLPQQQFKAGATVYSQLASGHRTATRSHPQWQQFLQYYRFPLFYLPVFFSNYHPNPPTVLILKLFFHHHATPLQQRSSWIMVWIFNYWNVWLSKLNMKLIIPGFYVPKAETHLEILLHWSPIDEKAMEKTSWKKLVQLELKTLLELDSPKK